MSQNDYQLNLLTLKLIFHNYSQCQTMLKSVKWLQVLSDDNEITVRAAAGFWGFLNTENGVVCILGCQHLGVVCILGCLHFGLSASWGCQHLGVVYILG